jgi:predicted CopG family antitoxin
MAVKTITIDMAAYDALSRHKRAGQSFSDVIKAHFASGGVGADLLAAARQVRVEGDTLDGVARVVASRKRSPARTPSW